MFMRFFQLEIKTEFINEFKKFYEYIVFPKLQRTPGCLFAGLIKSGPKRNEFVSITFWETKIYAENYENNGKFHELLKEAKPYLTESAEWKIHLFDNSEFEYAPVSEEPVIKKYAVQARKNEEEKFNISNSNMYVRIVSAKIQEGKIDEFKRLYSEIIIPQLKVVKGCEYVYLIESTSEDDEFISLTIWSNKEDADLYEASGKFNLLVKNISHTFSHFYLWKMALEKEYNPQKQPSENMKIEHYDLVTGKSFV